MTSGKGDVITTSKGPRTTEGEDPNAAVHEVTAENRWNDVSARLTQVGGVDLNNYGNVVYSEGDISDDDVAKLDADVEKAGGQAGQGRAIGLAARQMGVNVKFSAREGRSGELQVDRPTEIDARGTSSSPQAIAPKDEHGTYITDPAKIAEAKAKAKTAER